jgi:tetratricopeptide (TPR) repeat protein
VQVLTAMQDWPGVLALKADLEGLLIPNPPQPFTPEYAKQTLARDVWPYTAKALAYTGDMKAAEALIAKTPLDCLICLRVRGELASMRRDWIGAAHWFAMASSQSPSIPLADHEWGRTLLAKGDLNGAISKFESANTKGPHFADPLEGWGEALMLQNRSDLALAKFEEAARYAPNWGRLHLKWGEAAHYAGNDAEAKKQFAIAATLFLTPSEESELGRAKHG